MRTIRVLLSAALAFGLVVVGGFVATSANAHTPNVTADCDQLSVNLTNYNSGGTNRVVVTINDDVLADETFSSSYSNEFDAPDQYTSYHYVVAITAHDDPNGTNGWTKTFTGDSVPCEEPVVTPADGSYAVVCSATGSTVTIGDLDSGTYTNVVWTFTYGDQSKTVVEGEVVEVASLTPVPLALSYTADGEKHGTVQEGMSLAACPPVVTPADGSYAVVCSATGSTVTIGDLDSGTYTNVVWTFTYGDQSKTVVEGEVVEVASLTPVPLALSYTADGEKHGTVQEGMSLAACPPVVTPADGSYAVVCSATGSTVTIGDLDSGTYTNVVWTFTYGNQSKTVVEGEVVEVASLTPVPLALSYTADNDKHGTVQEGTSLAACPPPPPPVGEVVKTSNPATGAYVPAGSTIAYTVTVKNVGQVPIVNAPVVDTLPSAVTAVAGTVSDGGVVSADGRTITWTVSLPVGATKVFTYSGLVASGTPAGTQLVNKATFLLKDSTTTHVVGSGALTLSKVVSPVAADEVVVEFGDTLTYTLTASATGTLGQQNVVVTDYLPGRDPARPSSGSTTYVAGSAACIGAGTCIVTGPDANGLITWSLGDMAPGTSRQVTFQVVIDDVDGAPGETVAVDILNAGAVKSDQTPVTPSNEVTTPVTKVLGVKNSNEPPEEQPETQGGSLPRTGSGLPLGGLVGGGVVLLAMGAMLIKVGGGRRRRLSS